MKVQNYSMLAEQRADQASCYSLACCCSANSYRRSRRLPWVIATRESLSLESYLETQIEIGRLLACFGSEPTRFLPITVEKFECCGGVPCRSGSGCFLWGICPCSLSGCVRARTQPFWPSLLIVGSYLAHLLNCYICDGRRVLSCSLWVCFRRVSLHVKDAAAPGLRPL